MSDKTITCIRCKKPIERKSNLVVSNMKMVLRPFHEKCFKEHVKMKREQASMFFDAMPINGTYANIMTLIFLLLITSFALVFEVPIVLYVLCAIYPIYRLSSWLIFERKLA
uniref:hypothetical protein n=1 Tax=uncultured Allobacillus sp. TaxID=1638025 RepID=UPI002597031A|nr:hypothetical protein [uncultured Allobacillus sp.]